MNYIYGFYDFKWNLFFFDIEYINNYAFRLKWIHWKLHVPCTGNL